VVSRGKLGSLCWGELQEAFGFKKEESMGGKN